MEGSKVIRRRSSIGPNRGPSRARTTTRRRSTPVMPVDRTSMLVMEANEISQCLGKDYIFGKENEEPGDEEETIVKVTNRKLNITCRWSLSKLKERLVRMRKLVYTIEADSMQGEDVFFDPNDTWTKEESSPNFEVTVNGKTSPPSTPKSRANTTNSRSITPRSHSVGRSRDDIPLTRPDSPIDQDNESKTNNLVSATPKLTLKRTEATIKSQTHTKHFAQNPSNGFGHHRRVTTPTETIAWAHASSSVAQRSKTPNVEMLHGARGTTYHNINRQTHGCSHSKDDASGDNGEMRGRHDLSRTTSSELPGSSHFLMSSSGSSSSSCQNVNGALPEKYLTRSPTGSVEIQENGLNTMRQHIAKSKDQFTQTESEECQKSCLAVCQDMVAQVKLRLQGPQTELSIADRVLINCETVKVAAINILEGYTQVQDSGENIGVFSDSELMKLSSMQLSSGLELLMSHLSQWLASLVSTESSLLQHLHHNITNTRLQLVADILTFLKVCEQENGSAVQDSAGKIVDQLYDLCRQCGELSLATECSPSSLTDPDRDTIEDLMALRSTKDNDLLNHKPDADIKQSFLSGCDSYLTKTLEAGVQSAEEYEDGMLSLLDNCHLGSRVYEDVAQHACRIVTCTRVFISRCTEVQRHLHVNMRDDCDKPENYFHIYHGRCQTLISHTNNVVNGLYLLSQATETLTKENDNGNLRKISRCADIVQTCIGRLLGASNSDTQHVNGLGSSQSNNGASMDMRSESSEASSILSDAQCEVLDQGAGEVRLAIEALVTVVRDGLASLNATNQKTRRMLPATPGSNGLTRCLSARSPDRRQLSRQMSFIASSKSMEC